MFDYLPAEGRDECLTLARSFFIEHGHELAEAASQLGGVSAEARVISCGVQIDTAACMTGRIRSSLEAIHRLLALSDHGENEFLETECFLAFNPASPDVERICLLTDRLADLIQEIDMKLPRLRTVEAAGETTAA